METPNIKDAVKSKQFKKAVACLIIASLTVFVFALGMQVGFMKASFSFRHGENYYREFGPMNGPHQMGLVPNDVSEAHGVSGKIISVTLPTLVVADHDNTEKIVRIDDMTVIRSLRSTITPADLKAGDVIVVIGRPTDSAQVAATFIRVMPTVEAPIATPAQK